HHLTNDKLTHRNTRIDRDSPQPPKQIQHRGDFLFDALSNDGSRLYLLDYSGDLYHVRLYDIEAGQLNPELIVDKREGPEAMAGVGVDSTASADGSLHYGLYLRANAAPFIHALPLTGELSAWCVELPAPSFAAPGWALVRSPD